MMDCCGYSMGEPCPCCAKADALRRERDALQEENARLGAAMHNDARLVAESREDAKTQRARADRMEDDMHRAERERDALKKVVEAAGKKMSVKRYAASLHYGNIEHPDGSFVHIDDYDALRRERDALKKVVEAAGDMRDLITTRDPNFVSGLELRLCDAVNAYYAEYGGQDE